MADSTTEIDLDSVIDRLLEGESPFVLALVEVICGWRRVRGGEEGRMLFGGVP